MQRTRLDQRAGEEPPARHICVNAARRRRVRRCELDVGECELRPLRDLHRDLLRPVLAQLHNVLHALPCRCREPKLISCIRKPRRHGEIIDPEPAPCRHGDTAEYVLHCHHPIVPSNSILTKLFISTAYSSGSSFAIGSTKPRTIIARASSSSIPRLIR